MTSSSARRASTGRSWLRRATRTVAGAVCAMGLVACGGADVTAVRLQNAFGPAFAHLYLRQQSLLGRGTPAGVQSVQSVASCQRGDGRNTTGAGDDWVCQVLLHTRSADTAYTYDVTAKADGCYTADGPPALVGAKTLTTPTGASFVNPLFAIDGCFDTS